MFQVVLVEPDIPQNTGSVGRLCLATGTRLHLVEPLGFDISDASLRRAGLDYWKHIDLCVHRNWDDFLRDFPPDAPRAVFSKKAQCSLFERTFVPGTWLFFGKETKGLSDEILQQFASDTVRIPIYDERVRSLNLANAVSIAVYEALRQVKSAIHPH